MLTSEFKPRLTGKQIAHILSLCRSEKSEDSISVLLALYSTVIHEDYLGDIPALTPEEREAMQKQYFASIKSKRAAKL